MGGQSFKCPRCAKWFLNKQSLGDHLRDSHGLTKVKIIGVAQNTAVEPTEPCNNS